MSKRSTPPANSWARNIFSKWFKQEIKNIDTRDLSADKVKVITERWEKTKMKERVNLVSVRPSPAQIKLISDWKLKELYLFSPDEEFLLNLLKEQKIKEEENVKQQKQRMEEYIRFVEKNWLDAVVEGDVKHTVEKLNKMWKAAKEPGRENGRKISKKKTRIRTRESFDEAEEPPRMPKIHDEKNKTVLKKGDVLEEERPGESEVKDDGKKTDANNEEPKPVSTEKPLTAFKIFSREQEGEMQHLSWGQFYQVVDEKWARLTEEEKKEYAKKSKEIESKENVVVKDTKEETPSHLIKPRKQNKMIENVEIKSGAANEKKCDAIPMDGKEENSEIEQEEKEHCNKETEEISNQDENKNEKIKDAEATPTAEIEEESEKKVFAMMCTDVREKDKAAIEKARQNLRMGKSKSFSTLRANIPLAKPGTSFDTFLEDMRRTNPEMKLAQVDTKWKKMKPIQRKHYIDKNNQQFKIWNTEMGKFRQKYDIKVARTGFTVFRDSLGKMGQQAKSKWEKMTQVEKSKFFRVALEEKEKQEKEERRWMKKEKEELEGVKVEKGEEGNSAEKLGIDLKSEEKKKDGRGMEQTGRDEQEDEKSKEGEKIEKQGEIVGNVTKNNQDENGLDKKEMTKMENPKGSMSPLESKLMSKIEADLMRMTKNTTIADEDKKISNDGEKRDSGPKVDKMGGVDDAARPRSALDIFKQKLEEAMPGISGVDLHAETKKQWAALNMEEKKKFQEEAEIERVKYNERRKKGDVGKAEQ